MAEAIPDRTRTRAEQLAAARARSQATGPADAPANPTTGTTAARRKPGSAGRWVAAGGAVGASLAMVGVMSATTGGNDATVQPEAQRVVVMPQAPQQIVVVLPEQGFTSTRQPQQQVPVAVPQAPTPPPVAAPATATPAPVTESSGS